MLSDNQSSQPSHNLFNIYESYWSIFQGLFKYKSVKQATKHKPKTRRLSSKDTRLLLTLTAQQGLATVLSNDFGICSVTTIKLDLQTAVGHAIRNYLKQPITTPYMRISKGPYHGKGHHVQLSIKFNFTHQIPALTHNLYIYYMSKQFSVLIAVSFNCSNCTTS